MHAAEGSHAADLVQEGVTFAAHDDLVAAPTVGENSSQIAHRAAGDKKRRLFTQHFRGQSFQLVDRRVVAVNVVAYRGIRHRLAHGRRRPGDCVTAQIDSIHVLVLSVWLIGSTIKSKTNPEKRQGFLGARDRVYNRACHFDGHERQRVMPTSISRGISKTFSLCEQGGPQAEYERAERALDVRTHCPKKRIASSAGGMLGAPGTLAILGPSGWPSDLRVAAGQAVQRAGVCDGEHDRRHRRTRRGVVFRTMPLHARRR
jgi:hypothetical protein